MTRFAILILLLSALSACSGLDISENKTRKEDTGDTGSFLTGADEQGIVI